MYDLLIKNGFIVDGTGMKGFNGSVGIKGGKIEFVGDYDSSEAETIIDAEGLTITPGFIDCHSHSDFNFFFESRAINKLQQGITTEITGHCGVSIIPVTDKFLKEAKSLIDTDEYNELVKISKNTKRVIEHLKGKQLGTNISLLCAHGNIRSEIMGYENRKPTEKELNKMKDLVRECMEAGAIGMSTGLIYPPGVYAEEEEIIELCKVVAEYDGIYATHMRNESEFVIESVEEAIRVAEFTGITVIISHHKIAGKSNWGKSLETLKLVEKANERGLNVGIDQYPYEAGATDLINALPPKYAIDGKESLLKKLKDNVIRNEIKEMMSTEHSDFENLVLGAGFNGVLIVGASATPEFEGKTLDEIAKDLNKDPYDALFDLLVENNGSVGALYFLMGDEDIERIMTNKLTMGGTDYSYISEKLPAAHPRGTGTFVKIISEYIRDKKITTLEEGIRKLTSAATNLVGLRSKGILKKGYDADIVIFDYENLRAESDYKTPSAPNHGVKYVIINGQIVVKDDNVTGVYSGKLILG